MLNLEAIGKKIMERRKMIHMTQNELADALYVTRQAVSKWEMGKSLPSVEVLIEMTEIFDVTIDYMLDNSDLEENDYRTMFMQYPRESVIFRFQNSDRKNQEIKDIFYLLSPKERKQMIDQVISGQLHLDIHVLWPYLNMAERKNMLGNLLSKHMDSDLSDLYPMLSTDEKLMINAQGGQIVTVIHRDKPKHKGEKEKK